MEILVPLSPFIMVIALVWLGAWSRAKSNKEVQKSIQKAIEKGVELTPETIKAMGGQERSPQSDLRSGLISIAVALGMVALGFGIGEAGESAEIIAIMVGAAAIPGFIGVALLMMHFFMKKDKADN